MAVLKKIKKMSFSFGEKLGKRIKGSTLIESIVATVIIMFCFSVVTTVYVNVFRADDHSRKFSGHLILKNAALKIKSEKDFIDKVYKVDELTVEKTVAKYGESENQELWLLKLKLIDADKKLINDYKELIIN